MANKLIYYDGLKHADLWSDDPTVWSFLSGAPQTVETEYYSRVAAVYRAFNLKANTVGNMPFALVKATKPGDKERKTNIKAVDDKEQDEEVDNSATWQNVVKFLPNPSEIFRIDTLSYMNTNTIYNVRTADVAGRQQRGLYNAIPTLFQPETDPVTGALVRIVRQVGTKPEYYQPKDKRLFRAWRLDHTTEVLPSPHTEAKAILQAAGVLFYADYWVQNFYRRGGIKPTLIAMKGLISNEAREEKERGWDAFLRGLGKFTNRVARIFNAESMDIQPFGSGVDDMKDNKIYEQAISNIAMGTGMPLSLLMANSANYATAKEEKATWYENDIIPFVNWLAYEYNEQVFGPLGLRLEFRPETVDPQQEDESRRATAYSIYTGAGIKPSVAAQMLGIELPSGVEYADLDKMKEEKDEHSIEMQRERFGAQPGGDGPQPPKGKQDDPETETDEAANAQEQEEEPKPKAPKPAKWIPSLDELEDMRIWREVALRKLKKAESLDFEYEPHHGGLPADVVTQIKTALIAATTPEAVKAAFNVDTPIITQTPAPVYDSDIKALADSMNKLADAVFATKSVAPAVKADMPNVNITMPAITLTAQMPEQGSVIVNVPEQPAPVVNVTNEVQPTPIKNEVTVRPAPVNVVEKGKRKATVKRDLHGRITEITSDEE